MRQIFPSHLARPTLFNATHSDVRNFPRRDRWAGTDVMVSSCSVDFDINNVLPESPRAPNQVVQFELLYQFAISDFLHF